MTKQRYEPLWMAEGAEDCAPLNMERVPRRREPVTKHKFSALFPRMWEVPGEKCLHPQRRWGRITLVCARPKGHKEQGQMHLHDVPPELQR